MEIRAHTVCQGKAEGEAVVYKGAFSFLGDLDPITGKIPASIASKVKSNAYGTPKRKKPIP